MSLFVPNPGATISLDPRLRDERRVERGMISFVVFESIFYLAIQNFDVDYVTDWYCDRNGKKELAKEFDIINYT